jgi:branched-chain amino acid aminotransferase
MHRFILHNDDIREAGDGILSPGQVGLMNGWGIFSTLRIYDGVPFGWERHWGRMRHDAGLMRVPFPQSADWLGERVGRLIEANQAWNATLRVCVVRNYGGMFEGPPGRPEFDVVAFTREVYKWADVMRLGVAPHARHAASEFAGVKVLSWAENLTRYQRAHEHGLDEVVLLNERGEICECTSANIFLVLGSRVCTPPLASGCLPGVTRATLLEEVRGQDLEIIERTLHPQDLEAADEVFLTSTTRELLPVISVEGYRLKANSHPVRDRLQAAFKACIQAYVAARKPAAATR